MKFRFVFLLFTALILLSSCGSRYTQNKTILHAESILFSNTDSAYLLLSGIKHPEKLPQRDYAAWCLHYSHATLKLYKKIKSDSLIRIAVEYYSDNKLPRQSGTAYYVWGYILYDLGQREKSLIAFKKAEDLLENTNENIINGLNEFRIGRIYYDDENFINSINYYRKSLYYFNRAHSKKYIAYSCRAIADNYIQFDKPNDSIIHYLDLSIKYAKEAGDTVNFYNNLSRKGECLYKTNKMLSKEYILQGYHYFHAQRYDFPAYLAYLYSQQNKRDSAVYYLDIAMRQKGERKYKIVCYHAGAYVYRNLKNYTEAFKLLETSYVMRDSIFQDEIKKNVYRLDKQYDLSLKEKENADLKISNRNKVILISILLIVVLIIVILLLLILSAHKKKQTSQQLEKQRVEFELEARLAENNQKRELLLVKLRDKIENTLRLNRLKLGIVQPERMEAFLEELSAKLVLDEKEWQYYIDEVDRIYDKKVSMLVARHPQLTTSDLIVITLIALQIDISDSCNLLNMSKNTMYHRRSIVKDRIGLSKEDDLEEWVQQHVVKAVM